MSVKSLFLRTLISTLSALASVARGPHALPDSDTVRRIVVLQMSGVGDLLLITPALRALRQRYPHARIDLLTRRLDNAAGLFRLPHMGKGHEFALFDLELRRLWTPFFWRTLGRAIRFLRQEPCDLYVSFHHPWLLQWYLFELWVAARSGARFRVGINPAFVHGAGVFDRALSESQLADRHYRFFFLDVVGLLGDAGKDAAMEFPLQPEEIEEARTWIRAALPDRERIVCLHTGASHPAKCWPQDRFAALARRLVEEARCGLVFVGSPDEAPLVRHIAAGLPASSYVDAAGRTNIFQLGALIEACTMFIGNDSAPLHLAVARRRPTIGIIGPGDARYYRYHPDEAVILKDDPGVSTGHVIALKETVWAWRMSVEDVFAHAVRLLTAAC